MEKSVLNHITTYKPSCAYFDWCNGKKGYIVKSPLFERFEFIEGYIDEKGYRRDYSRFDNPVVAVGIVACWLKNRNSGTTVRQMFESYTEERFEQVKFYYRDEPLTWDWDDEQWKIAFYKWAIENEPKSNKQSEALLEYITDSDQEKVHALMEKYMDYLEKCLASSQKKPQEMLSGVLDTKLAREIFAECIKKGWMHETESGYQWEGIPDCRGKIAQLAYLCGKIYGFKYNKIGGNSGKEYPEEELDKLFKEKYLEKQLLQVYAADKPQKWRALIDELFE